MTEQKPAEDDERYQLKLAVIVQLENFRALSNIVFVDFHGQEEGKDPKFDKRCKQLEKAENELYAAIQAYANQARLDERRLARKDVEKQRPIFLTKNDVDPFSDDPMAEKVVRIREQLRREILEDFTKREAQLAPKEEE